MKGLISPNFDVSDLVRLAIVLSLGGFVLVNRESFSSGVPLGPTSPNQPWIEKPISSSEVKAGLVTFEGTALDGQVEVLENGRIVCVGSVINGRWTASGKLFGPGPTFVFVRDVAQKDWQSPPMPLTVLGNAPKTLMITGPLPDEFLQPGRLMIKGHGKPGDAVVLTYDGIIVGKATANSDGKWWHSFYLNQPRKLGRIRAFSQAEGEVDEVVVPGAG